MSDRRPVGRWSVKLIVQVEFDQWCLSRRIGAALCRVGAVGHLAESVMAVVAASLLLRLSLYSLSVLPHRPGEDVSLRESAVLCNHLSARPRLGSWIAGEQMVLS